MSSKKKAYRGPQPTADTFKTQQEFLDSLVPIPLESVDENSRTCSYCWRSYGESNPGQNDAEAPVRFKCNHVFGEQCMRSLFSIREPIRIDLIPLSFALGSKGADLGSRLSAYVDSHGVERSALLTGGSREKDFSRLLRDAFPPEKPVGGGRKHGLELLGKQWYYLISEWLALPEAQPGRIHLLENAAIFDADPSALENLSPFGTYGSFPTTPDEAEPLSYQLPSVFPSLPIPQNTGTGVGLDPSTMTSSAAALFTTESSLSPPPATHPTWEQEAQKLKEQHEKLSSTSGTWKDALSAQSKLDILVAKQKEFQEEEKQIKKQLTETEAAAQVLQTPSMLPPIVQGQKPDAPASALTEQQLAQLQFTKAKASREKRTAVVIDQLGRSFAEVYEAYERYLYDEAVAAGRPPPVKKLRLADPKNTTPLPSTPTPTIAPQEELDSSYPAQSQSILLTAVVHEKSLDAKGLQVAPPYCYDSMDPDGTDEEDEDDGMVDAERAAVFFASKYIILRRKVCQSCCPKSTPLASFLTTPEYLFWRNDRKAPDDCPKCRRILFKRSG